MNAYFNYILSWVIPAMTLFGLLPIKDSAVLKKQISQICATPAHLTYDESRMTFSLRVGSGNKQRLVTIELQIGNILDQKVDGIVSAANEAFQHCAGVAVVVDQAAGAKIYQYYTSLSVATKEKDVVGQSIKCLMGNALIVPSFNLKKKGIHNIINAVGPFGDTPNKEEVLYNVYKRSMRVASREKLRTIAFPPISTGIFGYPIKEATPIAIKAVLDTLNTHSDKFDKIVFVLYDQDENLDEYKKAYQSTITDLINKHHSG